jgi:hypothetical protein
VPHLKDQEIEKYSAFNFVTTNSTKIQIRPLESFPGTLFFLSKTDMNVEWQNVDILAVDMKM